MKFISSHSEIDPSVFTEEYILPFLQENAVLREEIRVAREAAEITANLVVKQFEETERILQRFQIANALRKAVLESATQIAIIATDKKGVITVFNKGAANLLEYRRDEIIGKETPEIFHDREELVSKGEAFSAQTGRELRGVGVFFEYALTGRTEQEEWTLVKKSGARFPVNMSVNALHDQDGAPEGVLCIASDITENKRSERALKESEKKYRNLINNIPNIVFRGYADGSIEFFDDKIEELTGYPRNMFGRGKLKWTDLMVGEDHIFARERFVEALRSDKSYIREYRLRKKNGDILWLQAGSQIVCDDQGKIEYITGALLNITEQKLAEQALHESEEKYRSLFNSGPTPVFVLDRNSLRILDLNPSAQSTYGYLKEELIGKEFSEIGELDRDCWMPGKPRIETLVNVMARHRKKDDTLIYVRTIACPIRYKHGDAIILSAMDITESVEKDAQLYQASKMTTLGEMSAGIAHELNQPLSAIKIGNEFLNMAAGRGTITADQILKVVGEVSAQVDRASQIINRLREFGRKPDFVTEKVSINTPIRRVLAIIGQQFELQNIDIGTELDETLPFVSASNNRLEQVVFNMLTNARDAILQKRECGNTEQRITIRSFQEDGRVVFTVTDTGTGIAKNTLEKIFEPFFTTKEVGRGMGLGLSIAYGIIRDYGGKIDVESEEGAGTTFRFSFPADL